MSRVMLPSNFEANVDIPFPATMSSKQSVQSIDPLENVEVVIEDSDDSEDSDTPKVPFFSAIADELTDCMPPHLKEGLELQFLRATAVVLGERRASGWQSLTADDPIKVNDGASSIASGASGDLTFKQIWRELSLTLPKDDVPKETNFRADRAGIKKYLMKRLTIKGDMKENKKKMAKFSAIYCGFICKMYFSKEGHNCSFEKMKEDVGEYIASEGLKARKYSKLFDYKIVIPEDIVQRFLFVDAISDTRPVEDLLRPHEISEDSDCLEMPPPVAGFSKNKKKICSSVMISDATSHTERIGVKEDRIAVLKTDISQYNKLINTAQTEIRVLESEIGSLKVQEQQQSNNQNLVDRVREFVTEDENQFEQIAQFVVDVVPVVLPIISKVDCAELTRQLQLFIGEFAALEDCTAIPKTTKLSDNSSRDVEAVKSKTSKVAVISEQVTPVGNTQINNSDQLMSQLITIEDNCVENGAKNSDGGIPKANDPFENPALSSDPDVEETPSRKRKKCNENPSGQFSNSRSRRATNKELQSMAQDLRNLQTK